VRITIRPIFAWYDLWVGFFWDQEKRRLYFFPIPCFGLVIEFSEKGAPYDRIPEPDHV